ncbi:hypothetical protein VV423_002729 [Cronobacter sakazakii]|uniref:hypothetical protein n=1 Tax=Cronobacter sakazakii TaxID=28141 RepID=UPI001C61611D|nr:hypothetical protein [Cronobacter sakazakii]ELY6200929.1 hypothetical protein [Cronobacter sakazakii]EMD7609168.1 hypothetical protein [Cronobacter sakazakii]
MAFASQVGIGKKSNRRGSRKLPPFIVFRKSKSGACCGSLNRSMPFRGERIDIQIDEEAKKIRIRQDENGYRVEPKGGQFSCSIRLLEILGGERIFMTLSEDGWWYGEYGNTTAAED